MKDGDQEIPNNYMPISLLTVLSKIRERVAHNQLTSYLIANQRLSPKQCGNKKWNSTETSILQTTDAIFEATEKKELAATVLLDMSKAFNSVGHETLLSKLQDIGLSPIATEWFRSYIHSRYQVVKIHSAISGAIMAATSLTRSRVFVSFIICVLQFAFLFSSFSEHLTTPKHRIIISRRHTIYDREIEWKATAELHTDQKWLLQVEEGHLKLDQTWTNIVADTGT